MENSFCGTAQLNQQLKPMLDHGLLDWVQLAQQLATTDWSNPAGVWGAVSGLAGLGGLAAVAPGVGLAAMGVGLAQTDWSNPGAVMGALGSLVGLGDTGGTPVAAAILQAGSMGYGTYPAAAPVLEPKLVPTVGRLGQGVEEVVQPRLTIDVEGRIVGQTDPKVAPETDEEVEIGFIEPTENKS